MDVEMTSLEKLTRILKKIGEIRTVRVSSAKGAGRAKNYSYWGVARYVIRLSSRGLPCSYCTEAAKSDRRSARLAQKDADEECRLFGIGAGHLDEADAEYIINQYRELVG